MKLTFIGAAHEVTGSCHYLEVGKLIFNALFYFGIVSLTMILTKRSLFSTKKVIHATSLLGGFSMAFGFVQFLAYDLFRNINLLKKIFKIISVYTTLSGLK